MEILSEQDYKRPYVRFARVAVENTVASQQEGRYVATDVDMVYITPPFTKDVIPNKVKNWFVKLDQDVRNNRIPESWVQDYKKAYEYWLKGQEMPLEGTPIRGWAILSPAQQESAIKLHILTVEQLSVINDEGIRRLGMGGLDMKTKAAAWLQTASKRGRPTLEMVALKKENESLKKTIQTLTSRLQGVEEMLEMKAPLETGIDFLDDESISVSH